MPTMELPTPQDVEILAVRAGVSVTDACRRVSLTPDVFRRWKRGKSSPSIESVRVLVRLLEEIIRDRDNS